MSKIYIVIHVSSDGECMCETPMKAFIEQDKAEEFKTGCEKELIRVTNEVEKYWEPVKDEFEELRKKIRDDILAKKFNIEGKKQTRLIEIINEERKIMDSNKYHSSPYYNYDNSYQVDELEIEYTPDIKFITMITDIYALDQLKSGEHPNDVEFELIDKLADSLDQFGTDEDGNRVEFKQSNYYKELQNEN
jgi:hypothetical protein